MSKSRQIGSKIPPSGGNGDERTGCLTADQHDARGYSTTVAGTSSRTDTVEGFNNERLKKRVENADTPAHKSADQASRQPTEARVSTSWWADITENYGSIELENKGSVARDHLALERTFLAWLRTSLSFASIGIAVTQLFRLNTTINNKSPHASPTSSRDAISSHLQHVGRPLGAAFIGVSIIVLFIGFHRYFESQHYVIRGKFPASRASIVFVALIAAAIIIASMVIVLTIARGTVD